MAHSPTEQRFTAPDGVELAWHEMGRSEDPVLILLHGLFSSAEMNWVRFGHAARLSDRGWRLILPDLRAHGASGHPHEPEHYPPDILADDGCALIRHLGLSRFVLGGYSLGARTAVRMVVNGARPDRLIIAGMGLQGLLETGARSAFFKRVLQGRGGHERGSPEFMAEAFLKTTGGDPQALLPLLDSFVDTSRDALAAIETETLVLAGREDEDNGSAEALAELLPAARYVEVPGNHMSAVTRPELGEAISEFLVS